MAPMLGYPGTSPAGLSTGKGGIVMAKPGSRILASLVLVATLITVWPGGVTARRALGVQFDIDHFECYRSAFRPAFDPVFVRLRDQFTEGPRIRTRVVRPNLFCNPVRKVHGEQVFPIRNPNNHLKTYAIESAEEFTPVTVAVNNQFGSAAIEVVAPARLMVPTRKLPHDRPRRLDHFKCYTAIGDSIEERVRLRDQFNTFRTTVLRPALLCNPVEKAHGDRVTPITNPTDHLVCYQIASEPFDRDRQPIVDTRNQFGREEVRAVRARLLCVPSSKAVP
jgi:hypothetical protein